MLALAAIAFFVVHGAFGAVSMFADIPRNFAWLVWVGVVLVGAHALASVATSREQLADREHPPSARKKRHLVLKWASGAALAAAIAVHIATPQAHGPLRLATLLALIALVAWHACIGMRSLLKDIGADRNLKTAARVVVCAIAAALAVACCASLAC